MDEHKKGIEIKLGLFITIGLVIVAILVVQFGRVGRAFQEYYQLKVEFPNASGLIKGADVQLAGAKIGDVALAPEIAAGSSAVVVGLRIFKGIKIPKVFRFQIGTTGLLGDRFVEVMPPQGFDPSQYDPNDPSQRWQNGDRISGERGGGLTELTAKGGDVMEKLRSELDNIEKITTTLSKELLSQQNLKNIETTLTNLKTTSANFADASKNIQTAAQNSTQVMDKAKEAMTTADSAAAELKNAVGDARKTLASAQAVFAKASQGSGLLPALLSDRELANNFKALIANVRRSGILFYRDPSSAQAAEAPEPSPRRALGQRPR
jgi:ABC-type transporter Mla subunit MlaD